MNAPLEITCPACGENVINNTGECSNCGAVLSPSPIQEQSDHPKTAKKRHSWRSRSKRARQVAADKTMERELKNVGKNLDAGDYAKVLKKYQAIRTSATSSKRTKIWWNMLELLEKSVGILSQQKKDLDSSLKHQPAPAKRSHPPSLAGRLALIPVLILAGIGLLGLINPVIFGLSAKAPATQIDNSMLTNAPSIESTVTSGPTPLPDPVPILNDQIGEIQDLFYWSAGEDIESLSFSADGQFIASGDGTGSVKVWRLWTDQMIFELSGTHAAFSPDGKLLGVAGPEGLTLYNALDGSVERTLDGNHPYHSVSFSPDSQLVVGGTNHDRFYIWSVNNGAEQRAGGGFLHPMHSLSFSQDGLLLAVASNENTYVWNLQEQKVERSLNPAAPLPVYYSIALDADGEWFATGQEDGQMYIWRISNGERMAVFNDNSRFVHGLQFFHGSNFPEILVSGDEVNLSFWIMEGFNTRLQRSIYVSAPILSLSIAPENKLIATGGKDGVIHLWGVLP